MKNTTLCYLNRDDCYLMLHRIKKKNDENEGKWIGVGGKMEEGESPDECVCREVLEETGLSMTQWHYRGIVTFVSDCWEGEYMHLFTSDAFEGSLTQCDEGELAWIPRSQLSQLPQWEGDRIFLSLLDQDIPFFSLKLCYEKDRLVKATLNGKQIQ